MAETLFYHLTAQPLERALPALLERTLQRGWRAVVRAGSAERVAALDTLLWTYREESFLPHGTDDDPRHPVSLRSDDALPNDPQALFLVDGADTADFDAPERIVVLFDGADEEAVAFAREQWKRASAAGLATYWRQTPSGGWEKAAESTAKGE